MVTLNANSFNSEGVRPLHIASIHGFEDIVTILLKECAADPNVKTNANQRTPLHLACQYNNIECVSLLIKHGVRANAKDCNGNTALHFCCTNGHIGPAILLLQAGSSLKSCNHRGNTPLHEAVRWDFPDITRLLLYYKAPLDVRNKVNMTPLEYARGDEVRMLLERVGSDLDDANGGSCSRLGGDSKPRPVLFAEGGAAFDKMFSQGDDKLQSVESGTKQSTSTQQHNRIDISEPTTREIANKDESIKTMEETAGQFCNDVEESPSCHLGASENISTDVISSDVCCSVTNDSLCTERVYNRSLSSRISELIIEAIDDEDGRDNIAEKGES